MPDSITRWRRNQTNLSPDQFADTEEQTPAPLVECESCRSEREATELNDNHLTHTKDKHRLNSLQTLHVT